MTPLDKRQQLFSVLVLVAILVTAAVPSHRTGRTPGEQKIFYLAEQDYNTPLIQSYSAIRSFPLESKAFSGFAGFEQHAGQFNLEKFRGLAQVTSFAGRLLDLADIHLLVRDTSPSDPNAQKVYLSESFWREFADASLGILGQEIFLDGRRVKVAGITYDPDGFFAGTEIWVPMRPSASGANTESLRILGRVADGVTWKEAQKELDRLVRQAARKSDELRSCKMIPAAEPITFVSPSWRMVLRSTHPAAEDS